MVYRTLSVVKPFDDVSEAEEWMNDRRRNGADSSDGERLLSRLVPEQQRPIQHQVELPVLLLLVHENAFAIGRNLVWRCAVIIRSQGK